MKLLQGYISFELIPKNGRCKKFEIVLFWGGSLVIADACWHGSLIACLSSVFEIAIFTLLFIEIESVYKF